MSQSIGIIVLDEFASLASLLAALGISPLQLEILLSASDFIKSAGWIHVFT
jgi:hypothetical protein